MKLIEITTKIQICLYNSLSEEDKVLIEQAKLACKGAYAPYSNFLVGAATRLEDGNIVSGSNQENVAFPSGMCAERVSLFYAQAQHPQLAPVAIAIAAYTQSGFTKQAISPCGACRQVLVEIENRYQKPIKVLLYGEDEIAILQSSKALLPLSFISLEGS